MSFKKNIPSIHISKFCQASLLSMLFSMIICFHAIADQSIVLSVGESIRHKVPRTGAISVSDGRVVKVSDQGEHLKVTGRRLGSASLLLPDGKLIVHVVAPQSRQLYGSLANELTQMRGLSLAVENKIPVVRGRLLRWSDWAHLADQIRGLGTEAKFEFLASIEPVILPAVNSGLRNVLREARLPDLSISLSSMTATVPSTPSDLKTRAETALAPYGIKVVSSDTALSLEPMIRVRLLVVEIRKSMVRKFGIQWPAAFQAQLLPELKSAEGQTLPLSANALEDQGIGRVLASPTLLCRSGKEAQFLAGGEFPIKILNFKVQDIVWKKYGVHLKIKPTADDSGRMSIAIETEVSAIDGSRVVDGVPGLFTNRIESHFNLSSSRTIVLSGLLKNENDENTKGLPWLADLPVIGALFGSQDFRDHKTELVVFVTPEVAPPSEGA